MQIKYQKGHGDIVGIEDVQYFTGIFHYTQNY